MNIKMKAGLPGNDAKINKNQQKSTTKCNKRCNKSTTNATNATIDSHAHPKLMVLYSPKNVTFQEVTF